MDLTSVDHALKTLYPKGVQFEMYKESALLAMVRKDTEFVGKNKVIDVIYAGNRARSASHTNARANTSTTQGKAFLITRKSNYAFGTITRETMLAARKDKGALIDALATETKSMVSAYKQDMSADLYGNGSGVRARLSSTVTLAGTAIILNSVDSATTPAPETVVHFEVGDVLQLSPNADGSSVRTGTITVTAVDRDAGTLTISANISTGIAAAAQSDYIVKQGDAASKPTGISGWVPATAPTSTLFFGVDRSVDPTRLGGIRYDGSSLNHEEALINGLQKGSIHGAFPKDVFVHPDDFGALELLLGSRKQYEDVEAAGIGFTALKINGPKGTARLFSDPWAIKGAAYALNLEHWVLASLEEVPHWADEDGNKLRGQMTADGFEFYLAGYYQFGCEAPGQNIRIKLPAI